MNPRESSLLQAAAILLSRNQDTAYGPAHAVRDALALEDEVSRQQTERVRERTEHFASLDAARNGGIL